MRRHRRTTGERALRRRAKTSEQRFRMVFDSAAQGISIGSDGMMTETNGALQRMLGYTGAELSKLHYTEITHPEDRLIAVEASDEVMSGKRASHSFESGSCGRTAVSSGCR
jgi:PAS domain S-box-containing protein